MSDSGAIGFGSRSSLTEAARTAPIVPPVSRATTIRRRRVVASLGLGTLVTFALGFALSAFFYLAFLGIMASVAYLGLLAYFHRLAVERAQKVVALETRLGVAMALDQARHHCEGLHAGPPRSRLGGSGWSVPDEEWDGRQLVAAGR
ncbi:MAG: hypothetical protein ACYDGN_07185 [Acidimicrobiales bacterium]